MIKKIIDQGKYNKTNRSTDRDPAKVKMAYTPDSIWRNRDTFLQGRDEIEAFLTQKWERENGYRLRKELFVFTENRIAVQFWYEWYDKDGQWWRTYGLEDWTFADDGLMRKRQSKFLSPLTYSFQGSEEFLAVFLREEYSLTRVLASEWERCQDYPRREVV